MALVVLTSTRSSWSSSSAAEIWWFLASFCTVLIGTCVPELLGCTELSSSAKASASPIEAIIRNRASGSLNRNRCVGAREVAQRDEGRAAPVRKTAAHGGTAGRRVAAAVARAGAPARLGRLVIVVHLGAWAVIEKRPWAETVSPRARADEACPGTRIARRPADHRHPHTAGDRKQRRSQKRHISGPRTRVVHKQKTCAARPRRSQERNNGDLGGRQSLRTPRVSRNPAERNDRPLSCSRTS